MNKNCGNVYEIDGPPVGYFYIGRVVTYKTVAFKSKRLDMIDAEHERFLGKIKCGLEKIGGGIIFWRLRPEIKTDKDTGYHSFYSRLETHPELYDSIWSDIIVKKEGEEVFELKDSKGDGRRETDLTEEQLSEIEDELDSFDFEEDSFCSRSGMREVLIKQATCKHGNIGEIFMSQGDISAGIRCHDCGKTIYS